MLYKLLSLFCVWFTLQAEERKTEVDKDSNDGSSDDDQTSTSSELSKRGVRILVPSTSQNVEESVTERKASEEQNIEVDDDSSDDDREIDVLPGHEEESAEIPVSPKALQTVEIPTSDSENDVVRLKIAENESDDYFANSDSESDDDELDDSESDEDIDYPVSPFASNPKLLVI